jgi:acetyltransferase
VIAINQTNLKPFFAPKSIAIVGASDDLRKFGGKCFKKLVESGFKGEIYPINPKYSELGGYRCYPSVGECPTAPDHVAISVSAEHVLKILEDCAAKGTKFATVFTAGFAETGTQLGIEMQHQLRRFADRTGMRLMGPNCSGFVNFVDGLALTGTSAVAGRTLSAGRVGIVAHSGGVGQISVMLRALELGLGISYQVSCGNDADLDAIDFIDFMVEDDRTDIIMVVAERISDGPKFFKVARKAAERQKPIVIIKLGRTEQGSRAAASHTGAVTGSDAVHDAAFRQVGVIRAEDCSELYLTTMLLAQKRRPTGNRCAAVAISGGSLVLLSDLGAGLGLDWPDYSEGTKEKIGALLPGFGKVANPTDLTAAGVDDPGKFQQVLEFIAEDPNIDVVIPVMTSTHRDSATVVAEFSKNASKLAPALLTGIIRGTPPLTIRDLIAGGLPLYRDILPCVKAVRATVDYARFLDRFSHRNGRVPERPKGIDQAAAASFLQTTRGILTERESKLALAAYGLPITKELVARDADQAVTIASGLGSRLALKIESTDLPHKTEAGAIRLNVELEDVRAAFEEVMSASRRYAPSAQLEGVLLQKMAAPGVEMILGVVVDPVFGPVVIVGFGGEYIEVLRDLAYRKPPFDYDEARAMVSELRGAKILAGARGKPAQDLEALYDAIVRLSWFAHDFGNVIRELDINPLIVHEAGLGATAVDALIALSQAGH